MDCDRIMVLFDGQLVVCLKNANSYIFEEVIKYLFSQEFDTPHNLMKNGESHFSKLAMKGGEMVYKELKQNAY